LRRSDCSGPGLRRRRQGCGFTYEDEHGRPVTDEDSLARLRGLAIPPAWSDVWICIDPLGHLQATGTDGAGRRQYLYHPLWREHRDRQKFRRMTEFAQALPRLRRRVAGHLAGSELDRTRVLAAATRMLDVGHFRIGGEEYAEQGGGLGLATLRKEHVTVRGAAVTFDYPAKSGVRRLHEVRDPDVSSVVRELKRRRGGPEELLAYRAGGRWAGIRSDDINDYIKLSLGAEYSAKDFRTWNATVLAAALLAAAPRGSAARTSRKRTINAAVRDVAELLGNTPAVARRAYIDPRVFDRYQSCWTIRLPRDGLDLLDGASGRGRRRLELAVLDLLADPTDSTATAKLTA
jgi:DNA topoisomerase-1